MIALPMTGMSPKMAMSIAKVTKYGTPRMAYPTAAKMPLTRLDPRLTT